MVWAFYWCIVKCFLFCSYLKKYDIDLSGYFRTAHIWRIFLLYLNKIAFLLPHSTKIVQTQGRLWHSRHKHGIIIFIYNYSPQKAKGKLGHVHLSWACIYKPLLCYCFIHNSLLWSYTGGAAFGGPRGSLRDNFTRPSHRSTHRAPAGVDVCSLTFACSYESTGRCAVTLSSIDYRWYW